MAIHKGAGEEVPKTINAVGGMFYIRTRAMPYMYFYIKEQEGEVQIIGSKKSHEGAGIWTDEQANVFLDKFKFRDSFEMVRVDKVVQVVASGN